jgi:carboxylate-amine ligase
MREHRSWWWELRPNPAFGTLEIRVPDSQATVADAAGVVAFALALVDWLAKRHDAGDLPPPDPAWRIAENRWSAAHLGLDGELADLRTGERTPTRERLRALLAEVGAGPEAQRLLESGGGAAAQRAAGDPLAATRSLADRFLA